MAIFGATALKALPNVFSPANCADYATTVKPYISQLQTLPSQVADTLINDPGKLVDLYVATNPLVTAFGIAFALAPLFLAAAEINRNYSQVDRFWSILPNLYVVHYALYGYLAGLSPDRMYLAAMCTSIWSARLTFNYWRRGGYQIGSEDYRWELVKNYVGSFVFFLLDVVFISFAQMMLLCVVTVPAYAMLLTTRLPSTSGLQTTDLLMATVMLSFVGLTFTADQQQWNYHQAKATYKSTGKPAGGFSQAELERGFLTSGLWKYSRHPNFFSEQGVWVSLYVWSALATGTWFSWTFVGPAAYMGLFQPSTWLTELITSGKYSEYKTYQRQVGKMLPGLGSWKEPEKEKSGAVANGREKRQRKE